MLNGMANDSNVNLALLLFRRDTLIVLLPAVTYGLSLAPLALEDDRHGLLRPRLMTDL